MEEKKNCKIIQDLLPSYIEKLTNEETNQYIENHLKDCKDCKKTLENMQNDLKVNTTKIDNREVKYIKKFNHKLRTLKVILLIILIIFVIVVGRKMIIITNLSNKAEQYTTSTNYHRIIYSYDREIYTKTEIYCLNNKIAAINTKIKNGNKTIQKVYTNGNKVNIYWEIEGRKIAKLNQDLTIFATPQNTLYTENFGQLLVNSIKASIYEVSYNGKECYYISGFMGPYSLNLLGGTYIDKETGLVERLISSDISTSDGNTITWPAADYIFEFNTVTEADFIEPDISEYELQ